MKTATIPSLRVEEELRAAAESVLVVGESLSSFVVESIRDSVQRRQTRQEFIARGLRSRDEARALNDYVSAPTVVRRLEKMRASAVAKTRK